MSQPEDYRRLAADALTAAWDAPVSTLEDYVAALLPVLNRAFLDGKDAGRREAIDDLIEYLQEIR